jgi:hypothetical protein
MRKPFVRKTSGRAAFSKTLDPDSAAIEPSFGTMIDLSASQNLSAVRTASKPGPYRVVLEFR